MKERIKNALINLNISINENIEEIAGRYYVLLQFIFEEKNALKDLDPNNKLIELIEKNTESLIDNHGNSQLVVKLNILSKGLIILKDLSDIPEDFKIKSIIGDYRICKKENDTYIVGIAVINLNTIPRGEITVFSALGKELKDMVDPNILEYWYLNDYSIYYTLRFHDGIFILNSLKCCLDLQSVILNIKKPS